MSNIKISELTEALSIDDNDLFVIVQNGTTKKIKYVLVSKVTSVNGKTGVVVLTPSDIGAYSRPVGGIPASDLAQAVQSSLALAETALQSAPVSSVNGQTGAVVLAIPSSAADVGAIPAPASPAADQYIKFNGSAWVASSLPLYNGGVS